MTGSGELGDEWGRADAGGGLWGWFCWLGLLHVCYIDAAAWVVCWDVIAWVRLFCEVFSESVSGALGGEAEGLSLLPVGWVWPWRAPGASGVTAQGEKLQNGSARALVCPVSLERSVWREIMEKRIKARKWTHKTTEQHLSLSLHVQFVLVLVTPVRNSPEAIIQGLPNSIPS